MSVYAIHRMLRSRDLGPKKLLGPVREFAAETKSCGSVLPAFNALLGELELGESDPSGVIGEVIEELGQSSVDLQARIDASLGSVNKLGARERLELERQLEPLGQEIQALRNLLQIVDGALHPRPAHLTLSELLWAPARGRPAFVWKTVEVHATAGGIPFHADPRVMWGLLERSLLTLAEQGIVAPFAGLTRRDGQHVIEIGDLPASMQTIERVTVNLSAPHQLGDRVLDAVACHQGALTGGSARDGIVTISVAA